MLGFHQSDWHWRFRSSFGDVVMKACDRASILGDDIHIFEARNLAFEVAALVWLLGNPSTAAHARVVPATKQAI